MELEAHAPLWPAGLHPVAMGELNERCVRAFPASQTRRTIWRGLIHLVNVLQQAPIKGDLWIGGSFVTTKVDPGESEIVLRIANSFLVSANYRQREAIGLIQDDLRHSHRCESFLFVEFPRDHPAYEDGQEWREYWLRQLGGDPDGDAQGIAVLAMGGGFSD